MLLSTGRVSHNRPIASTLFKSFFIDVNPWLPSGQNGNPPNPLNTSHLHIISNSNRILSLALVLLLSLRQMQKGHSIYTDIQTSPAFAQLAFHAAGPLARLMPRLMMAGAKLALRGRNPMVAWTLEIIRCFAPIAESIFWPLTRKNTVTIATIAPVRLTPKVGRVKCQRPWNLITLNKH